MKLFGEGGWGVKSTFFSLIPKQTVRSPLGGGLQRHRRMGLVHGGGGGGGRE